MRAHLLIIRDNKLVLIILIVCFIFLSQSCNGWSRALSPTQTPVPLPSLTPTLEECSWSGIALAWNDSNGNGIREDTESPLSDVRFFLEERLHNSEKSDFGSTGRGGSIGLNVLLPGCPDVQFEVYPEVPQNCQLTTPIRILSDPGKANEEFSFGFLCH